MAISFFGTPCTQKPFFESVGIKLIGLVLISLFIYFPILYAQYLYTDEASQVWYAREGINQTSLSQGRYITYFIFTTLFRFFDTVNEVRIARIIALLSWMLSLPVWYYVLKKTIPAGQLARKAVILALVYMVSMPAFAITVCWAACLEMPFACTTGLISGYLFYRAISLHPGAKSKRNWLVVCSALMAFTSLFTYQNAFGCFFICFFLQFIAEKKITRAVAACFAFSALLYLIYFIGFKVTVSTFHVTTSDRVVLAVNPINKLIFLLTRPLATSGHLTLLFDDASMIGIMVYVIIALCWFFASLKHLRIGKRNPVLFYLGLFIFLLLTYLPSLMVAENFASHRTLFAMDMLVFILLFDVLLHTSLLAKWKTTIMGGFIVLFICNAWYNVRYEFVYPMEKEFAFIQLALKKQYSAKISTVHIIGLQENSFASAYGTIRSWDEFGVPSTAKKWTAEPLIKQLIYELTRSRQVADRTIIRSWKTRDDFKQSRALISDNSILIEVEDMFQTGYR